MNTPRRLDTDRRREFALRLWVAERLLDARVSPVEGTPLSRKAVAEAIGGCLSIQALERIESGAYLPRYRKALKMAKWIHKRLGIEPASVHP